MLVVKQSVLFNKAIPIIAVDTDREYGISGRVSSGGCLDDFNTCLRAGVIPSRQRDITIVMKTIDARARGDFKSLVLFPDRDQPIVGCGTVIERA